MFGAFMGEDHPQPVIRRLDPFHAYPGLDANSDTLALRLDPRDGIGVHGGQQLRQRLEDRHISAGPRVNVAKFQRDNTATDENHRARQLAFAQHFV